MPQDLIIGAKTGGSSNLLRVNNASRRFSFRDVDGSWKEAVNVDYVVFEKPDEASKFLVLELSANQDYSSPTTLNSQTDQSGFIYYNGSAWASFPASGITPNEQGALVAFNFGSVLQNFNGQIYFRFWWSDGSVTTEKKASIFPAMTIMNSGASSEAEIPEASDTQAGIARAATQTEVDGATAGFTFVTPTTLAAKKFAASQINGLATVATSGDYNDLSNKYELPAASTSVRGGIKIGSNINLTNNDVISVASASAATAGVIQLASSAEVTAGTDGNKAVTPATLKVELNKKANSSDLKAVATSGSYNDLTDKPTIPEVVAASTTQAGIVRLATTEESSGSLGSIAVTPAGLSSVLSDYYTSTEIDSKITTVLTFKGVKATEGDLPSTNNKTGDVWIVSADSSEYVWNGDGWEKFGPTISLDGYLTTEAAAQTYVAKTQLATAAAAGIVQVGQNIEVNTGVISVAAASTSKAGVIALASAAEVTAGTDNTKAVTPATLKVELNKKANSSSLAAVATSGDYNDLSNKYELPAATSSAIGGVKPGGNLTVTADGTLNFTGLTAQSSDGSSLSSEVKVVKAGSGASFSYASGVLTIGLDSTATGGLTSVSVGNGLTGNGTSSNPIKLDLSRAVMEHDCDINAQGRRFGVYLLSEVEISATSISLSSDSLTLTVGNVNIFTSEEDWLFINATQILLNRHKQNTAGGFAIVGSDGKLPDSIIPTYVKSVNNVSPDGSGNVTIDINNGSKIKRVMLQRPSSDDSLYPVLIASQTGDFATTQTIDPYATNDDRNKIEVFNGDQFGAFPSTGGLGTPFDGMEVAFDVSGITYTEPYYIKCGWKTSAGAMSNYKAVIFPSVQIVPTVETTTTPVLRHSFTSSDLSSNVLTITTTGNVTGVIDDSGKAWNFADEEVTYTDSTVSVDLSGVFARKGIVTPAGTWKLMLYGA